MPPAYPSAWPAATPIQRCCILHPRMLARDFEPPLSLSRQMLKDLHNVEAEGARLGLDLPLIAAATARFQEYADAGGALADTSSVYRLYDPAD